MINFAQVVDDVTLDCDEEPKTVFRIRSLSFGDDVWVQEQMRALGEFPVAGLSRLLKQWHEKGTSGALDEQHSRDLEQVSRFWAVRDRSRCIKGVIEIDRKAVSPEEVESKLDALPATIREKVCSELAGKIAGLGAPDPKSQERSESPRGSGRILTTPAGDVNSAR